MDLKQVIRLLVISWTIMAGPVIAQQADLSVGLLVRPQTLAIGEVGFLDIAITNNGPEAEGGSFQIIPTLQPNGNIAFPSLEFLGFVSGRCVIAPDISPIPGSPIGVLDTPILALGETETCTFAFRIPGAFTGNATTIHVIMGGVSLLTEDPDNSNNVALTNVLLGQPLSVPALEYASMTFLIFLLGFLGVRQCKKQAI